MRTRWRVPITDAFVIVSSAAAADRSVEPIISHIRREPVECSALAAVGYSKRLHALEIEFRDSLGLSLRRSPGADLSRTAFDRFQGALLQP